MRLLRWLARLISPVEGAARSVPLSLTPWRISRMPSACQWQALRGSRWSGTGMGADLKALARVGDAGVCGAARTYAGLQGLARNLPLWEVIAMQRRCNFLVSSSDIDSSPCAGPTHTQGSRCKILVACGRLCDPYN